MQVSAPVHGPSMHDAPAPSGQEVPAQIAAMHPMKAVAHMLQLAISAATVSRVAPATTPCDVATSASVEAAMHAVAAAGAVDPHAALLAYIEKVTAIKLLGATQMLSKPEVPPSTKASTAAAAVPGTVLGLQGYDSDDSAADSEKRNSEGAALEKVTPQEPTPDHACDATAAMEACGGEFSGNAAATQLTSVTDAGAAEVPGDGLAACCGGDSCAPVAQIDAAVTPLHASALLAEPCAQGGAAVSCLVDAAIATAAASAAAHATAVTVPTQAPDQGAMHKACTSREPVQTNLALAATLTAAATTEPVAVATGGGRAGSQRAGAGAAKGEVGVGTGGYSRPRRGSASAPLPAPETVAAVMGLATHPACPPIDTGAAPHQGLATAPVATEPDRISGGLAQQPPVSAPAACAPPGEPPLKRGCHVSTGAPVQGGVTYTCEQQPGHMPPHTYRGASPNAAGELSSTLQALASSAAATPATGAHVAGATVTAARLRNPEQQAPQAAAAGTSMPAMHVHTRPPVATASLPLATEPLQKGPLDDAVIQLSNGFIQPPQAGGPHPQQPPHGSEQPGAHPQCTAAEPCTVANNLPNPPHNQSLPRTAEQHSTAGTGACHGGPPVQMFFHIPPAETRIAINLGALWDSGERLWCAHPAQTVPLFKESSRSIVLSAWLSSPVEIHRAWCSDV